MSHGLVDPCFFEKGNAKIVVGVHVVGIDFQRFLVMRDGLVDPSATGQDNAEVVVGSCVARRFGHRVFPNREIAPVIHVALESEDSECDACKQHESTADELCRPQGNRPATDKPPARHISAHHQARHQRRQ